MSNCALKKHIKDTLVLKKNYNCRPKIIENIFWQ